MCYCTIYTRTYYNTITCIGYIPTHRRGVVSLISSQYISHSWDTYYLILYVFRLPVTILLLLYNYCGDGSMSVDQKRTRFFFEHNTLELKTIALRGEPYRLFVLTFILTNML